MRISGINFIQNTIPKYNRTPAQNTDIYTPQESISDGKKYPYTAYFCAQINKKDKDEKLEELKKEIDMLCQKYEDEADLSTLNKVLTKENIHFTKWLLEKENFPKHEIYPIAYYTDKNTIELATRLCNDEKFPKYLISKILKQTTPENINFVTEICTTKNFPKSILLPLIETLNEDEIYTQANTNSIKYFIKMYQQCIKNAQNYVNNDNTDKDKYIHIVNLYFSKRGNELLRLSSLEDSALNDILLRKKFLEMNDYLKIIKSFSAKHLEILKQGLHCKNTEGKALTPPEKVDLIEIINAYKLSHHDFGNIKSMIAQGVLDLGELKSCIISDIFSKVIYNPKERTNLKKENLLLWDQKFSHLLVSQLQKNKESELIKVIKLANETNDFKQAISQFEENKNTEQTFNNYKLNYIKWLTPSNKNDIHLTAIDKNTSQFETIANKFQENVNTLLQSKANVFINKKYPQYIKEGQFTLSKELKSNKAQLETFIKNFEKELSPVWERALKNKGTISAQNTLTIREHILSLIENLKTIEDTQLHKPINLKITMWKRYPQKDLFQGNYSTCCIGINKINANAMEAYLMSTALNMIEILDEDEGKTIGNALCYYVIENNKPALIIDNIEVSNNYSMSPTICKKIRDGIVKYAHNLNKEISENERVPIYLGCSYNDAPCEDLTEEEHHIENILGNICTENTNVYLDVYKGWTDLDEIPDQNLKLYKLTN